MQNITSPTSLSPGETTFSALFISIGVVACILIFLLLWKTGVGTICFQLSTFLSCIVTLTSLIFPAMLVIGILVATGTIELPESVTTWMKQKAVETATTIVEGVHRLRT